MTKVREILDTWARNWRMKHWPVSVLAPFEDPESVVAAAKKRRAEIDVDRNLTTEGKVNARESAKKAAKEAINKWHAPRLSGLDADIAVHRTKLLPSSKQPDARQVDFLLGRLRDRTPEEINILYGSATREEKELMEAAAQSVGRIPLKSADGGLDWKPLLPAEVIHQSVMQRARAKDAAGVEKFEELQEIRAMHVSIAGNALAEIDETFRE